MEGLAGVNNAASRQASGAADGKSSSTTRICAACSEAGGEESFGLQWKDTDPICKSCCEDSGDSSDSSDMSTSDDEADILPTSNPRAISVPIMQAQTTDVSAVHGNDSDASFSSSFGSSTESGDEAEEEMEKKYHGNGITSTALSMDTLEAVLAKEAEDAVTAAVTNAAAEADANRHAEAAALEAQQQAAMLAAIDRAAAEKIASEDAEREQALAAAGATAAAAAAEKEAADEALDVAAGGGGGGGSGFALPDSNSAILRWDNEEVNEWLEERSLSQFEEDVEGWDGKMLVDFGINVAADNKTLGNEFKSMLSLMGARPRRRAVETWIESLVDLLELVYGAAAPAFDALTPRVTPKAKRAPVVFAVDSTDATTSVKPPTAPDAIKRRGNASIKKRYVAPVSIPFGSNHVMSITSSVASSAPSNATRSGSVSRSRPTSVRRTGKGQRPRQYLNNAGETDTDTDTASSPASSPASASASASASAPASASASAPHTSRASRSKSGKPQGRAHFSRRNNPRGRGNNERYAKAKAAAAATAEANTEADSGREGAESESGDAPEEERGNGDDRFYSTLASAAANAAEREAAVTRAQVAIEVDAGDGDLISVLNRLEGRSEADLALLPHWLGEQYGNRAIEINLSQGYLTGLASMAAFTVIKVLILDNNRLESLASLPSLPLLNTLSLRHNKLSDLAEVLKAIQRETPGLRQLACGGNPCTERVPGQTSGLKLRLQVVTALPALAMLDSKPAREGMHPLWILSTAIWNTKIAKFLSFGDLAALSETCTTGTEFARSLSLSVNVNVPWTAGGTGVLKRAIKMWPNVAFETTCCSFGELDTLGPVEGLDTLIVHAPVLGSQAVSKTLHVLQAPRAVRFESCESITACPKMPNVKEVTFKNCGQLNLVTALSSAKSIVLEDCPKLKMIDVIYRLANADTVTLKGCKALSAVGDLGGKTVCTSEMINGHRREWKRKELNIQRCPSLASLRGLGSVHTLILKKCSGLQSLAGLETVHTVILESCPKVRDLSPITSCQSVTLRDMPAIVDATSLGSCPDVTLDAMSHLEKLPNCSGSTHAPLLQHQRIQVKGCPMVESVEPLAGAAHIVLERCMNLPSLDGIQYARSVAVRHCPSIDDVSQLVDVPNVHLEMLERVRDTSMLRGAVVVVLKFNKSGAKCSKPKKGKKGKSTKGRQQTTPEKATSVRDAMAAEGGEDATPERPDLDMDPKAKAALQVVRTLNLSTDSADKVSGKKGIFSGWFSSSSPTTQSPPGSPSRKLLKAQKKVAQAAGKAIRLAEKAEALKQKEASEGDELGSTDFESDGERAFDSDVVEKRRRGRAVPGRAGRGGQPGRPGRAPDNLDDSSNSLADADTTQDVAERDATSTASTAGKKMWTDRKLTEDEFFLEQLTAASGYIDLGHACRNEKEYDSAVAFFYKALGTYRSLPESNATLPVKIANVYTNLGVVYGLRKLHEKEMDLFKKALECYREHHGFEHVNTAMAFNNLGIASRNSGDRSAAMNYFKKALGIYRGLYGERHPESIRTQRNIDRLQSVWNSRSAGTAHLVKA